MTRLSAHTLLLLLCGAGRVSTEYSATENIENTPTEAINRRHDHDAMAAKVTPRLNTERLLDFHRNRAGNMKHARGKGRGTIRGSSANDGKPKIRVASTYGDSTIVVDRPFAVKLKPSHREPSHFSIVLAHCGFDCDDDTNCGETIATLTRVAPVACFTGGTCKFEFVCPEILKGSDSGRYRVRVTDVRDDSLYECSGPVDIRFLNSFA
ncbi:unnamed protein product [Scytosiphon promiscuus]